VIPMLRTLWNCYSFTVRYMLLDDFDPRVNELGERHMRVEDRWIISRANAMLKDVEASLKVHEYHHGVNSMTNFIVEDLSRWYIKIIRDRLWLEDEAGSINPSKKAAYMTLEAVFRMVCTGLAPIAPFVAEEIYQNMLGGGEKSIHHVMWPKDYVIDANLNDCMDTIRGLFESGSKCRQDSKIKLRYPVKKIRVSGTGNVREAVGLLRDVIAKQLNAKEVEYVEKLEDIRYVAIPDFKVIGPAYGAEAVKVANAIRDNPDLAGKIREEGGNQVIGGYEVSPEMISDIRLEAVGDYAAEGFSSKSGSGVVLIDTGRDESLMNEALARDLIRNIQEMRKEQDLSELDVIEVAVSAGQMVEGMLEEFGDVILKETRAKRITPTEGLKSGAEFAYEGHTVHYGIRRL
jgi:isoleucyl-tRNA synthetase